MVEEEDLRLNSLYVKELMPYRLSSRQIAIPIKLVKQLFRYNTDCIAELAVSSPVLLLVW